MNLHTLTRSTSDTNAFLHHMTVIHLFVFLLLFLLLFGGGLGLFHWRKTNKPTVRCEWNTNRKYQTLLSRKWIEDLPSCSSLLSLFVAALFSKPKPKRSFSFLLLKDSTVGFMGSGIFSGMMSSSERSERSFLTGNDSCTEGKIPLIINVGQSQSVWQVTGFLFFFFLFIAHKRKETSALALSPHFHLVFTWNMYADVNV